MVAAEIGTKRTASVRKPPFFVAHKQHLGEKDTLYPVASLHGYFLAGTIIASTSSAM
jgi:hypothetical protein